MNRSLASVCQKQVHTAIHFNRTNFNTVLMTKLVVGNTTLVGAIPLYDEHVRDGWRRHVQGYLIEREQTISLFEEEAFSFELPSAYRSTGAAGVVRIVCTPREKRTRYCYLYRESTAKVERPEEQAVLTAIASRDFELRLSWVVRHSEHLTDGEKSVLRRYIAECKHPFLALLLCDAVDVPPGSSLQP